MRKILLTLAVLGAAISGLNAQIFKTSGRSASELFNEEVKEYLTAEGDLNKDGIKDLVIAINDYWIDGDKFAFYFGDPKDGYTLFRGYDFYLSNTDKISITDKGTVRIQNNRGKDCDVFIFRYQEGDFHLIGSKKDRHDSEHYDISHNYSTGKMIRTDGEGAKKKSETLVMPEMPPLKFGWFPLDLDEMDYLFEENTHEGQLEEKTLLGIFNRMLNNGMIFANLYPNENNLSLDADGLSVSMEYMSIGNYNYWSNVEIYKEEDPDTYFIHMFDQYEDRSYERYDEEEDIFVIDESYSSEEPRQKTTETKWIFENGRFVLLETRETFE
jgi:hypothetical protein